MYYIIYFYIRGGFDSDIIINWCLKYGVYVIILIGGDGTHRAGNILYNEISKKKLNICVACVPKTIDNDIAFIDRSFGFDTAVEEAAKVVKCAVTEAKSTPRGIGIVRLMGRTAGSIAAFTAMSTGLVDLCLIPEVYIYKSKSIRIFYNIYIATYYMEW